MPLVDITLLGGFTVRVAGEPVTERAWRRRSASAVVKLLALSEGRALHREQVVEALWPDLPLATAMPRLHQAAHYARSALGSPDGVVLHHDRVLLLPGADVRVDLVELHRRAEQVLRTGTATAADEVLAGFGEELLPEDLYDAWTLPHREAHAVLRDRLRSLSVSDLSPGRTSRPAPAGDGLGRAGGLLLIVDDLAGADTASLRMLHRLAATITARGVGRVLEIGSV